MIEVVLFIIINITALNSFISYLFSLGHHDYRNITTVRSKQYEYNYM